MTAVFIFSVFAALPVHADVAPKWTDADLTAFSDAIVTGRVVHVSAAADDRVGAIYSYVTLDVDRVLKGQVTERRITIKQLGGQVGATALEIAGQATFAVGEEVLLFLEARPRDGTLATTALWQGKFTIVRDASGATARRDDPQAVGGNPFSADARPLDAWVQSLTRLSVDRAQGTSTRALDFAPRGATGVSAGGGASAIFPSWRTAIASPAIRLDAMRPGQAGLPDGGEAEIRRAAEFWSRSGLIQLSTGGLRGTGCLISPSDEGSIAAGVDDCGELGAGGGTLAISGGWARYETGIAKGPAFVSAFVMTNASAPAARLLARSSCFEAVMTHEIGHALGLGHSSDESAPMNAYLHCDAGFGTIVSPASSARTLVGSSTAGIARIAQAPTFRPLQMSANATASAFQRVSISGDGTQGNGDSTAPAISGDGRCIAFQSIATNLVSGDTNGVSDIFVFDRVSGLTTRESISTAGTQADAASRFPAMGATCRYVAFVSDATNLVSGVSGTQVYLRDRTNATTAVASVSSAGVAGNAGSGRTGPPAISGDGRFVAFDSDADNLVSGDTNGVGDVFTHDMTGGTTTRDSTASDGAQAVGGSSRLPSLSSDGLLVAFDSEATNLVPIDAGSRDVFVKNRNTGQTTLESVGTSGTQVFGQAPWLSSDGRYIVFNRNNTEIYFRDRSLGTTSGVVSVPVTTFIGLPRVSADGRNITYQRGSTVEVYDRNDGTFGSVAAGTFPTAVTAGVVAFASTSALVAQDTNALSDVYIATVTPAPVAPTPVAPTAPTGLGFSLSASVLTLTWVAPTGTAPTSYVIEAGSSSGAADLANFSTGSTATSLSASVGGSGTLFIRVRATNAVGTSPASNEVVVNLGVGGVLPPGAPSGLAASVSGSSVTLVWTAPTSGGAATSYVIEAGSSSGASNLAAVNTGSTATSFSAAGVGAGTYFVRVRASNVGGTSGPSNEILLLVGSSCSVPGAPSGLSATVAGSNVTLTWTAGANATSYQLLVGSSPGTSNVLSTDLRSAATSLSATGVASGSYFARVRSLSGCGQSGDSNEVLLIVR